MDAYVKQLRRDVLSPALSLSPPFSLFGPFSLAGLPYRRPLPLTFLPYQSLSSLFFMNTSRRQQSNHVRRPTTVGSPSRTHKSGTSDQVLLSPLPSPKAVRLLTPAHNSDLHCTQLMPLYFAVHVPCSTCSSRSGRAYIRAGYSLPWSPPKYCNPDQGILHVLHHCAYWQASGAHKEVPSRS